MLIYADRLDPYESNNYKRTLWEFFAEIQQHYGHQLKIIKVIQNVAKSLFQESTKGPNIVRLQRYFHTDTIVRSFNEHEAFGNHIVKFFNRSTNTSYIAHISCYQPRDSCLIASSSNISLVRNLSQWGQYKLEWSIIYKDLIEIPTIDSSSKQIIFKTNVNNNKKTIYYNDHMEAQVSKNLRKYLARN
ncbi:unnamed protein product [Didymodactylos carnosus]|uniref:Intermembrane lipid transfer protein VPS13-like C-terminal domain-containing protein n=1 Tax=Didymodactylos carnosus TaxID=1234261 RepID=A0A814N2V0_9BILA|nr:unnamed protein product [Didymodactylos carnosus]CAF3851507.1 unnamed protein product [Didymodactylos carnosus]